MTNSDDLTHATHAAENSIFIYLTIVSNCQLLRAKLKQFIFLGTANQSETNSLLHKSLYYSYRYIFKQVCLVLRGEAIRIRK